MHEAIDKRETVGPLVGYPMVRRPPRRFVQNPRQMREAPMFEIQAEGAWRLDDLDDPAF
jgi:hypothetical protein